MNQLAIEFSPLARRSDPVTSHIAAARSKEFSGKQKAQILDCLKSFGPQSKCQISAQTGIDDVAVARRLSDLKADGLALPTDETRLSDSGRPERVWSAD